MAEANNNPEMDDVFDDTPDFVDVNDAVEVRVDDDDVPMDEGDDDDEQEDEGMDQTREEPVENMAMLTIEAHTDPIYSVDFHLEGENMTVISGGGDDKAFLHQVSFLTRSSTSSLLDFPYKDSVSSVALNISYVSKDLVKTPLFAAVGAFDGSIVLFDPISGSSEKMPPVKNLEGPSDVEWMCWHPKGGSVLLVGASGDNTVWMYHTTMNKCLQVFVGHESAVTAGSFSPDGKWALSASADGTLRVWAPRTGVSKHVFRFGNQNGGDYQQNPAALTCMAIGGGSDGQLTIVGGEDGQAHVCHIGTKKVVASLRHFEPPASSTNGMEEDEQELPMSVEAVGFSPAQPNWCATGGVDGVLKIWDLANGAQCRQTCQSKPEESEQLEQQSSSGGITRLRWHPSLPLVFTATFSGNVQLWDARDGRLLRTITGHTDVINDMTIQFTDSNKAIIVTGSDDKSIRVFEIDIANLAG